MKHEDIWRALDTLAAENGLSASGLARRSGLDPTTFNPSKRRMPDGRNRWPSTESVAKVLDATGASLDAFATLVSGARALASNASTRAIRRAASRSSASPRRAATATSMMAATPSVAAGMRYRYRKSAIRMPMRWKSAAIRWNRCFATAIW